MAHRTGSANLPLHGGHVPPWLATRMATLGRVIVEAIVHQRLSAIRRLDSQARALERIATGPSCEAFVAQEKQRSAEYGGRTVHGPIAASTKQP